MSKRKLFLVTYDVEDDKRRKNISEFLSDFGYRIQKSVFCMYLDRVMFDEMKKGLKKLIDRKKDRARVYIICRSCRKTIEFFGISDFPDEQEFFLV